MRQAPHHAVHHHAVKDVGAEECDAGPCEPEPLDEEPREAEVDDRPRQLGGEEQCALVLGDDDVAHRPADHAQRHAEADPAQGVGRGAESGRIEHHDDEWREGQRADHTRPGEQQADPGLLVDQAVAMHVVGARADQPRVEISPHRLQDEADVQAADRPRCLVEPCRLQAVVPQHDEPHRVGCRGHQQGAGHEGQAELQQ